MEIVVCIKQVPDVDNIKWTKENNLDRSNMLSKLNSYDEIALDWALNIKKKIKNCNITTISMGPNQAKEILEYSIAKGSDRAILLSDRSFSGSDTYVTSKILSKAIKKYVPDFDLIITGILASDGDTRQVPVSLATFLDVVDYNNIVDIKDFSQNEITFVQCFENSFNTIKANYPALISVSNCNYESYIPKIDDYINAQNAEINCICANDIELNKDEIGIIGSPTMVYKAFRPSFLKDCIEIKEDINNTILNLVSEAKSE